MRSNLPDNVDPRDIDALMSWHEDDDEPGMSYAEWCGLDDEKLEELKK